MASISASIIVSSPSLSQLQKPTIATCRSPVLRLPTISRVGKVRCTVEGKPTATTSDDEVKQGLIMVPGKNAWPELVGKNGEVAAGIIKKENPLVDPIVISRPGVIGNWVSNRVWVPVNSEGLVIRTPVIG